MKLSVFIALSLASFTASAHADSFASTVTQTTGLAPGSYRLRLGSQADERCQSGALTLKEQPTEFGPAVYIYLNGQLIAGPVGARAQGLERGEPWKSSSSISEGAIQYDRKARVGGKDYEWHTRFLIRPDGFTYGTKYGAKSYECDLIREG